MHQAFLLPTTALALRVLAPPKSVFAKAPRVQYLLALLQEDAELSGVRVMSFFEQTRPGGVITTSRSAATRSPCAARGSSLAVGTRRSRARARVRHRDDRRGRANPIAPIAVLSRYVVRVSVARTGLSLGG